MISQEELKKLAAVKAVSYVIDGMRVGLGTGSTVKFAVEEIARKLESAELTGIVATPTSFATRDLASDLKIPLKELDEIDVDIDGTDQIDLKTGVCIKGGGGAHFWEKKVARKSKEVIIVVDESKVVTSFAGCKVPLEVETSKLIDVENGLRALNLTFSVRPKKSDSGNLIVDVVFDGRSELVEFEKVLLGVEGVLDTGIFAGLVTKVVVAKNDGEVEVIKTKS